MKYGFICTDKEKLESKFREMIARKTSDGRDWTVLNFGVNEICTDSDGMFIPEKRHKAHAVILLNDALQAEVGDYGFVPKSYVPIAEWTEEEVVADEDGRHRYLNKFISLDNGMTFAILGTRIEDKEIWKRIS